MQVPRLVDKCRAEWDLKSLSVTHTIRRGYCFVLRVEDVDLLPLEAVQAVKKKTRIIFTSEELLFLNNRLDESFKTILLITAELVEVIEIA